MMKSERAMIIGVLFFTLCLVTQACIISESDNSAEKNIDSTTDADGVQLNVELMRPCSIRDGTDSTSFKNIRGKTRHIKSNLRNCKITITRTGKVPKDGGFMSADLSDVARVITYFCNDKTPLPPHVSEIAEMKLCDEARNALGNLVIMLEATKYAGKNEDEDETYARDKDYLQSCYQPDIIDVADIQKYTASSFIKQYPNEGDCGSDLPIRAYMTYIYSHLNNQLLTEIAFATSDPVLKANDIDYDTVRHWYRLKNTEKLNGMFVIGAYSNTSISNYKTEAATIARMTYWKVCFTLVKEFISGQGVSTRALTGNFYSSSQPALATFKPTHEYSLFGNYSTKYIIDLTDAEAQLEEVKDKMLQDLVDAISAAGKSKDEVATAVSTEIKAYTAPMDVWRKLVTKVAFTSYP